MNMQIEAPHHIERPEKGRSLIAFPENYTVIDLETTGFSAKYDSILEISAVRYRERQMVESYHSLVKDNGSFVNSFIQGLTGITQHMINSSPNIESLFPDFLEFIGKDIVVGHNVNFDINFIYETSMRILKKPFTNDFVDTMRLGRKLHPELKHHRLIDMIDLYSIPECNMHRALTDCELANDVFLNLRNDAISNYGSIEGFKDYLNSKKSHASVRAKDIIGDMSKQDEDNLLYGKVCVFTGKLEKMTREQAMQIVADIGGVNANSVTKKTNYLILGNNDYCSTIKDGKSKKQKKAEEYKLKGQDIEVIPEDVFYDLITTEI